MKFKVLTPVEFDKRYEPGEIIELDGKTAEPLIEVGAIAKLGKGETDEATKSPAK